MNRLLLVPWLLTALACGGSSSPASNDVPRPDPGLLLDICYAESCGQVRDDGPGDPGGPDGWVPPADPGGSEMPDPGRDPGSVDPGNPPVDPGVPPQDPGGTDTWVDPGPPCQYPVSPWGMRDNCNGTLTDTHTGLTWQKGYTSNSDLTTARESCNLLNQEQFAGYTDWRLPTIDELRTLIVGCDANTGPNGSCPVHATTIDPPDPIPDSCKGCGMNQGPVEKPGDPSRKCYLDSSFDWLCNLFWSNTQVRKASVADLRSWYVTFYDAAVNVPPPGQSMGSAATRCVRGP
ncbi:MAG TPA: DUF1566 domain-containing protein [Myxococcota bacterium]|nr:DUF1566 domain-containing protein [Myxococcota bacterium]HQK49738.1 DUF1566 domain-containing protein [Myxococcota bacterium]